MANRRISGLTVEIDGDISSLKDALIKAEGEVRQLGASLKKTDAALKLDPTNVELLENKQKTLRKSTEELSKAIEEEKGYLQQLKDKGVDPTNKEYADCEYRIARINKLFNDQSKEITLLSAETQKHMAQLQEWGKKLDKISDNKALTALSHSSTALLTGAVASAMSYENSIADIRKVVSGLTDETVNDLKQISIATGSTFSSIATYASIGGTLGIAEKDLATFTKTMADLETATSGSIAGEDGAKSVARFLNVLGIGTDQAENFGSALTSVGDQYAATGGEILEIATQLSGLKVLNLDANDLIGLGAELKNLGLNTEAGASGITRAMLEIEKQVETGGKNLETFATTAGMTSSEFKKAWETDALSAFLRFTGGLKTSTVNEITNAVNKGSKSVKDYAKALNMTEEQFKRAWSKDQKQTLEDYIVALGNMDEGEKSAISTLNEVSLSGVRVAQVLLRLAGNEEEVRHAVKSSEKAWESNTALADKAGTVYETTSRQLKGAWESIKQAGQALGNSLLPTIGDLATKTKDLAEQFSKLSPEAQKFMTGMLAGGMALKPTLKAMSKLALLFGSNAGAIPASVIASFAALAVGVYKANNPMSESQRLMNELVGKSKALKDSVDDLGKAYDEEYYSQLLHAEMQDGNIARINELIGLDTLSQEQKEELKTRIDELNQAMGDNVYQYDETTGKIVGQNGAVQDLKKSYDDLLEAKRKEWFIDSYTPQMMELEQFIEQAKENKEKIKEAYLQTIQEVYGSMSEEEKKLAEQYLGNPSDIAISLDNFSEYGKKYIEAYQAFNNAMGSADSTLEESQRKYDLIKSMIDGGTEITAENIQAINNLDVPKKAIEDVNASLEGVKKQIEYLEEIKDKDQELFNKLGGEEELDSLKSKYDELKKDIEDKIKTTSESMQDESKTASDNIRNNFIESATGKTGFLTLWNAAFTNMIGGWMGMLAKLGIFEPPKPRGKTKTKDDVPTGYRMNDVVAFYENEDLDKASDSYYSSINSSIPAVGTSYNTDNRQVKVNFTVNSTKAIELSDIQRYGNEIADIVNDSLGKRM